MCNRILLIIGLSLLLVACGGGGGNGTGQSPPTTTKPPVPTEVTVSKGGDGAISVDWRGSASAARYYVYWSDSAGVNPQNGTRVQSSGPPQVISGLTNDSTYYAVVTAENSAGETPQSLEAQGEAGVVGPNSVTGVVITEGDEQVTVQWDSQADADSYSLYYGTNWHGGGLELIDATSPHIVDGLTNGTTYYFEVAANNEGGQSNPTGPFEAIPLAPVPGWTKQVQLNDDTLTLGGNNVLVRDVALNESGVAAVVWLNMSGQGGNRRRTLLNYTVNGIWGDYVYIDGESQSAGVAITPDGEIFIANDLDRQGVRVRRLQGGILSDREFIESGEVKLAYLYVDLAADDQGNVFAAWVEAALDFPGADERTQRHEIWTRRFDASLGSWGEAVKVGESAHTVWELSIEAGADNRAVVAWLQDDKPWDPDGSVGEPNPFVVHASWFDGTAWQPAEAVGSNDLVDEDKTWELTLDVNSDGSAAVIWTLSRTAPVNNNDFEVGAARFDAQFGQWSSPELVADADDRTIYPDIAIDEVGNCHAVWIDGLNSIPENATYDRSTALWSPVTNMPTPIVPTGRMFGIEVDENGTAMFIMSVNQDIDGVFVRRMGPGDTTWGDEELIGVRVDSHPDMNFIMNKSGHALVVNKSTRRVDNLTFAMKLYAAIYSPN